MTVTVCVCVCVCVCERLLLYTCFILLFLPSLLLNPSINFEKRIILLIQRKPDVTLLFYLFFSSLLLVPYLSLACRARSTTPSHTSNSIIVIFSPFLGQFLTIDHKVYLCYWISFSLFFSSPFGHRLSSTSRWRLRSTYPIFTRI